MNKTLKEIWNSPVDFWEEFSETLLGREISPQPPEDPTEEYNPEIEPKVVQKYFFMIYAKYANSTIVGSDEDQWKDRFFLTFYEFAPAYQQKYKVQKRLRTMSEEDMLKGAIQKTTHGFNPSTDITGNTDTEITTVNDQNLLKYTKGTLDGYNNLLELLKSDVTDQFVSKFKPLFIKVPLRNYWEDDDE